MNFDPRRLSRPPQPKQQAQTRQQTPFAEGQILGAVDAKQAGTEHLTDIERRVLEQAGVQGANVNLQDTAAGKRIAAQVREIRNQAANPQTTYGNRPPIKPEIRDFSDLSPEEQREIQQRIEATQQAVADAERRRPPEHLAAIPGGQQVWDTVVDDDLGGSGPKGKEGLPGTVSHDKGDAASAAAVGHTKPASGPTGPRGGSGLDRTTWSPEVKPEPEPEPSPKPEPKPEQPKPMATNAKLPANQGVVCPHCGMLTTVEEPEITDSDKAMYLGMLLGGRFYKTYPLFDGHVHITFRNQTPREKDAVMQQLVADVRSKRLTEVVCKTTKIMYDVVASIERIETSTGGPVRLMPLLSLDMPDGAVTPLPALCDWLFEKVITSDSLWRVVHQTWIKYATLLDALDAKKDVKDFFSQIVPAGSCYTE